jgi:5S rRNA maturation endonuclease (ribonuclease M5)
MTRDEIIRANPIVDFVRNRGHELKPAGKNFVTNACPIAHHKKFHRCVTIDTLKNLWHCNDCKRGGTVIDWEAIDKNVSSAEAMRSLAGCNNGSSEIVATYDYIDEVSKLLFQCVRFHPKDFRQRQPDRKGGWIWNLEGVRRVVYRLPEVIKAQTVCVAEGEKDVDQLRMLGFVATTNPMGAGKWRDEYSETLRDKDVIVFGDVGDDDGAGERHTKAVIESLDGKAKSIKHVTLPDGFHDVSDYVASLKPDKARDIIRELIDQTRKVERQSLGESDGEQTDLISFFSCAVDYPAPPDKGAFYGLAGETVDRIKPNTEADPAALLFQLLAAFGNIIGRTAFVLADGARHYLNLFIVLVGETAKGRKGTALQHILNLVRHLDDAWCKNNIAHGLSSGEGLIWLYAIPFLKRSPSKTRDATLANMSR